MIEKTSGTVTLTATVQQTIATITDPGTYVLVWDMVNMDGTDDDITVDFYNKIISAGPSEITQTIAIDGATYDWNNWIYQSEPIVVNHELVIKMVTANNAAPVDVPWSLICVSNGVLVASGTETVVEGAPAVTLLETTTPGMYVLQLDLGIAYGGGAIVVNTDTKVLTGEAYDDAYYNQFTVAPTGITFWQADPVVSMYSAKFALAAVSTGGNVDIQWAVTRVI